MKEILKFLLFIVVLVCLAIDLAFVFAKFITLFD